MAGFNESVVEQAALAWLEGLSYIVLYGPDIAPGEPAAERTDYREVLLTGRLREALGRLNPGAPPEALEEATRRVSTPEHPSLVQNNRAFHRMLADGLEVEVVEGGEVRGRRVRLVDFERPENNNWLAVNQFTVVEGQVERRPDVVVFLNGLPIAVIELKNTADERATLEKAHNQLRTYQLQLPRLFAYNELLVISDGPGARLGCLGAEFGRFLPWKTVTGTEVLPEGLETLIKGVFEPRRLLEYLRHFVVFEDFGTRLEKKIAAYHQFHAVQKAVRSTVAAAGPDGDRRGGVVWHTQGSGKSLTMVFFAGELVLNPELENPTLVVLTDRNDLDDQLFGTFARCQGLLRQAPEQAVSRADLRRLLGRVSGGVVFTTIQKFLPEEKGDRFPTLSERRNIVVIADEAHRSQYGFDAKVNELGRVGYGFAQNVRDALPGATFVGFTGTPVELGDRDTRAVFGEYVDIYDVERAVQDGATVPIYYESRLVALDLMEGAKELLDEGVEEVTEGEELAVREKTTSRWTQLTAIVGTRARLAQVAQDLVEHFEARQNVMFGKGMVVCMSRQICVELYDELTRLRPGWEGEGDKEGALKVVMTGAASDPPEWQRHVRSRARNKEIAKTFRDPATPLKLVIVRDMWLTGFDVPSLHTMYLDKPMQGHSLMQAIARVNRVFRDKPGGLVVDYLGLADNLKKALARYTESSGGDDEPAQRQEKALEAMYEKLSVCRGLFHGFDYADFLSGTPAERVALLAPAQDHILGQDRARGKERFLAAALDLAKAYALAVPLEEALAARQEIIFFQTVRAALGKGETRDTAKARDDLNHAIRQLVERAVAPEGVIDIFAAAGLKKPDISILSEGFLAEVRDMPQRNLAVELLGRLLKDEVRTRSRKNVIQARLFSERLEEAIAKYQNRGIETAQVIEELIALAKEMREAGRRGENLGLTEDELAFYDALEVNDSAVKVLGDETLRTIARELADTVRQNVTVDWAVREQVRANLRRMVKRVLRKHGYPPDKQEEAARLVVEQAEVVGRDWAA